MPHVSICVPTYNNVGEVHRLLDSIKNQTYRDIEVIISDDSTNDEIAELVNGYDMGINYIHNPKPLGHIFNWNAAIAPATGDYIKIMFSDDWFTFEDSLEKMVVLLDEHPDASMVFTGSRQVKLDENGMPYRDRCASDEFLIELKQDYRIIFCSNQIGAPSATMYRANPEIRFDEKSNWASDVFLYFEILERNNKVCYTTEPLISIGEHQNQYTESFTSHDARIYHDYEYMYRKYGLDKVEKYRRYFRDTYRRPYAKEQIKAICRRYMPGLKRRR